jgi:hypothetical protein
MTQPFDPYAEDPALAEYKAAQDKEWGEYVVAQDYYVGVALAARRGDAIPVDNVKRHKLDEQGIAVKRDSKEGRSITGEPEPEPAAKPAKSTGGKG